METKKVFLTEDEIPRQWYNVLADIKMNPPLGPDGNPISPDMPPVSSRRPFMRHRPFDVRSGPRNE